VERVSTPVRSEKFSDNGGGKEQHKSWKNLNAREKWSRAFDGLEVNWKEVYGANARYVMIKESV
jgi:hypothetical protein